MRKQIIAVLAILVLAATAFVVSVAVRADASVGGGGDCTPTQGHYTDWLNEGPVLKIEPDMAEPPTDSEFERWVFLGTEEEVLDPGSPGTEGHWEDLSWFVWTGGPRDDAPGLDEDGWNDVPALPQGLPHEPVPGTVYNVSNGESGRGSWFKYDGTFVEGTDPVPPLTQTLRLYQHQTRTWVEGEECPPPVDPCVTDPLLPECGEEPVDPCVTDPSGPGCEQVTPPNEPDRPQKPNAAETPVKKATPQEKPETPAIPVAVDAGI